MNAIASFTAVALALLLPTAAAQPVDPRTVLTRTIGIERQQASTSVPIELGSGKLFVDATVNGQTRSFIFDTGSPTILSRSLADALGLKTVARNTGVDAHGKPVTMDIAVVDSLSIGGATFRGVPVLIFDFSTLPLGRCLIDGGTMGSEIFPGSSWTIDLENRLLTIAGPAAASARRASAVSARLHDFGYPHAPIVGYSVGGLSDKALFDTGNSEQLTLFRKAFDDSNVQASIVPESLRKGRGSEGVSAGGRSATTDLFKFDVSGLRVGGNAFPTLQATTRDVPPTLLGAGLLDSYVVTLDYAAGRVLFEPRRSAAPPKARAGYAIGIVGDHAEVVQLFEATPAAKAGLRLGDRVAAVNSRPLDSLSEGERCQSAKWLAESFDATEPAEVVVLRDGKRLGVNVPGVRTLGR